MQKIVKGFWLIKEEKVRFFKAPARFKNFMPQRCKKGLPADGVNSFPPENVPRAANSLMAVLGAFLQFGHGAVQIGAYACFVCGSLVVLVIAFAMPFGYTCVAIRRKENSDMAATRNLCAQIPIALHDQVCEAREQAGLTTAQYITNLLTEYFEMKKNGGNKVMANSNSRTLAFQIPEELFNRIKAHLERETARTGRKLTQRDFVLGLIEEALEAAVRQAGEEGENAPCEDGAPQDGPQPQEEDGTATDGEEQAV